MTKRISSPNHLTEAIERRIIKSGADGTTYNDIMMEMRIGRTCAQTHIHMLEDLDRVYRVRRTQPDRTAIYYTLHAKSAQPLSEEVRPVRRDPLVAALFGPARGVAA